MGAAPFRPFGDLRTDRGDLYAVHYGAEGRRACDRTIGWSVVRCDFRHRAEARLAGPLRLAGGRALSRARLEWRDALSFRGRRVAEGRTVVRARGRCAL